MRYCSVCVLPETRPNLRFDDRGNCNCATGEKKRAVDWAAREKALRALVQDVRAKGARYDCIIPVSGGKDSTWQVIKALEYGMRPLCVTWRTPARNALGQANLDNLIKLGVDHFDVSINPKTERTFTFKAFEKMGSPALPMHMAIFAIPVDLAIRYAVPLVLWGENSAFEYGGDDPSTLGTELNRAWLLKYGVTNGTTAEDWIDADLPAADMAIYRWPSDQELRGAGVRTVFLGQYLPWDPVETYREAAAHGFRKAEDGPKTGYYAFADVDDEFLITIHHWLKWYKFGFTRLWDNLSLEIRNGRMTRDDAVALLRECGDARPDAEIDKFCAYVGISRLHFFEIAERFRNPKVWRKDGNVWRIDDFLIPNWTWS